MSATTEEALSPQQQARVEALRKVLLRRPLRLWASKIAQERAALAADLLQLFTSSALSSSSSTSASSAASTATAINAASRPITRRPGVEEVRHCVLASPVPGIPPACASLRGEIWQVLLNVYKRNQHGAAAQEFERMILRLGKLPRDPLLVEECETASHWLCAPEDVAPRRTRAQVQNDLELLLVWFLTTKSVPYVRGMARVVAVFFSLELPVPTVYDCFYQYCAVFVPQFVTSVSTSTSPRTSTSPASSSSSASSSVASLGASASSMASMLSGMAKLSTTLDEDDLALTRHPSYNNNNNNSNSNGGSTDASVATSAQPDDPSLEDTALQIRRRTRQHLVEQLLSYHDPLLAHFLNQWCPHGWSEPGQLIPESLFLDDVYNVVSPRAFVYVMDQYLLTGDALFGVFVLVAVLVAGRESLMKLRADADVQLQVKELFHVALQDERQMEFVCMMAASLRRRTPVSYTCSQVEDSVSSSTSAASVSASRSCASRRAISIAFEDATTRRQHLSNGASSASSSLMASPEVDMSQWQKRESRSFSGKIFWYHTPTGRTQWEHPGEVCEPPPALFALPVSADEVAAQVMGEKQRSGFGGASHGKAGNSATGSSSSSAAAAAAAARRELSGGSNKRFFVVDLRGIRSSEDLKSGRIPTAFTLDPSVFDSPELIERSLEALNPMKSCVHIVLVGNGVGIPPELVTTEELKTSIRDAVRHDTDCINRAALFFQKQGFRFISCLDGGYTSWHAFMRDDPMSSPQELLAHVQDECHYCRYDTILSTGKDPLKDKKQSVRSKMRRKKSAMPTTTTMLVNGGEGDASIVSTNAASLSGVNRHSMSSVSSASSGPRLSLTSSLTSSLSRPSLTGMGSISSMRSKLSDVKMPKLNWRRGGNQSTATQNDSSSETATAEDGGSDRGSTTTDDADGRPVDADLFGDEEDTAFGHDIEESKQSEGAHDAINSSSSVIKTEPQEEFVGVFTIDYSDDEDEELELVPSTGEQGLPKNDLSSSSSSNVASAAVVGPDSSLTAPTISA